MERSTRISHGLFLVCFRPMKTKDLCIKKGEKFTNFSLPLTPECGNRYQTIGHFRVVLNLILKSRLSAKLFK